MHNMQLLCPYYVKDHIKAMLHWQMCGPKGYERTYQDFALRNAMSKILYHYWTSPLNNQKVTMSLTSTKVMTSQKTYF